MNRLVLAGLIAALAAPVAAGPRGAGLFRLGVWVGADPYAWKHLPGKDSASTIRAICSELGTAGMNTVWVSGFDGWSAKPQLFATWLDAAREAGLGVVFQGSGGPYALKKGDPDLGRHASDEVIPAYLEIARTHGGHPALLAYVPVEEIGDNVEHGEMPTVLALDQVARAVAAVDPVHPVITVHIAAWINVLRAEVKVRGSRLAIACADLYPFTHVHDWSHPSVSWKTDEEATAAVLSTVREHVALAATVQAPFWLFAQGFGSTWVRKGLGRRANMKMPTPAQIRFQVFAPLVAGARGVLFFSYYSTPEPPDEDRKNLAAWESNDGLVGFDGRPTSAYEELQTVARRLRPELARLGRIGPAGEPIESAMVVGRLFTDPADGSRFVVLPGLMNMPMSAANSSPRRSSALMARIFAACPQS